jgi:lysyl-tRNA synthetase class 2
MGREEEIVKERLRKLEELKKIGIEPYPHFYEKKDNSGDLQKEYKKLNKEKFGKKAKIAGRIISIRSFGRIIFARLQDFSGEMQVVLQDKKTSDKLIDFFKKYIDIGDFIGAEGRIFKTKTGELSVLASKIELLSKSILPLPGEWQGLQDKEERYRKRYLDLIMNSKVKEIFEKRAEIIGLIREFMKEKEFTEVETPNLQTIYGGASAKPFKTHLNALNMDLFLSISPELHLKRLIAGGFERVFTICKNFRNEGIDAFHNPEFTMLEFYYAYANYEKLMKMTEELFNFLRKKLNLKNNMEYRGEKINLKTPFKIIKFRDIVLKKTGIDIDKADNFDKLKQEITRKNIKNINIEECKHYGALLDEIYKKIVRQSIIQPTFLINYPAEMIALAKRNEKDKSKINSFQLLIDGAEIVKAYDELNDSQEQEARLKEQAELLRKGNLEAMPMDDDFINALKIGMPPTAGYGLGIDRLVMLLTGQDSIRDVILFPFMKPEEK